MKIDKTRKLVYLGLLSAIAVVLHIVEGMIPLPLPFGAKLGLANIISLVVIELYGAKEVIIVNFFRVILSSLLTGTIMHYSFFISCGGVLMSTIAIIVVKRFLHFPLVSTSIISALFHSTGQLIVVSFVISSIALAPYIFLLFILAIPTGIFTGLVANEVVKRVKI